MKAVIVITALVAVVSAGIPCAPDAPGRDLFTRQNACTKADNFCNDGDAFFTRCCDGLKCVVEQIPQIGRTKVCR